MRYILAAMVAALVSSPAAAVDFSFRFEGTGVNMTDVGSVTGTIFGLSETGTSGATRVFVQTPTEEYTTTFSTANSFTIDGGQIVDFNFDGGANNFPESYRLALNIFGAGVNTSSRALDITNLRDDNNYVASSARAVTFTRIDAPTTPAVPEPATWAMMLIGFGMVGGAARYRRRSTATTYA